ncbi:hypothetical protein SERLA73DRAFT_165830 [Serpula lacrymans var. lacrymans S7.3]|uniref:Uncharacterized protein n=2 Tax=Serpula lacrymans var. lacrymans TaxID=341189 RepID=F8PMR9_SERL3|nr:uncharacterized protein SERLADRAFT_459201 [Serpula lacrymans var. lacrymans S7.9]EGO02901.1 hypothetical protein SERLA73DRAFT_165830 [Serpula lacrymans var. lacrymans S7.3]EGO28591.1 hypothetical protein SERLADRAFT_459201 [Serpula lacrymans var. lacrymans S7.9]
MVIIDEKCMNPPPPPYVPAGSANVPPPPFPHQRHEPANFSALPSHLLLKIVYMTFPQTHGIDEGRIERQRKTLYWLSTSLRLVNHSFYIACMHVLRSTYLPAYNSLIRPPYSSDPFPLSAPSPVPSSNPFDTVQRETQVLDLFIVLKVREDVMMDDSELHLEREESFKDLFDLMQPRSRLEDLVRYYGLREGVVHTNPSIAGPANPSPTAAMSRANNNVGTLGSSHSAKGKKPAGPTPLSFSALSVSFSSRKVGLVLTSTGRKRTIVEVARSRDEKLEVAAKKLAKQLKVWLSDR